MKSKVRTPAGVNNSLEKISCEVIKEMQWKLEGNMRLGLWFLKFLKTGEITAC